MIKIIEKQSMEQKTLKKNPLKSDYYVKVNPEELKKLSKAEKFWIFFTSILMVILIIQWIFLTHNKI